MAWPGFNNVVLCIYYMFSIHASAALKENSRSGGSAGGGGGEGVDFLPLAMRRIIGNRLLWGNPLAHG